MAQLKDLLVTGATRLIGEAFTNTIQITTINAPTSAGGTTYGPGENGKVLTSNGSSIYWDDAANGTVTSIALAAGTGIAINDATAITTSGSRTISLATISTSTTTSTAAPAFNGTFTAIDSLTFDSYGRVSQVNTKTITLPSGAIIKSGTTTPTTATLAAGEIYLKYS